MGRLAADALRPGWRDGGVLLRQAGPRKHYHSDPRYTGLTILVGHRENEPWFGTSCPPECPQPDPNMKPMEGYVGDGPR